MIIQNFLSENKTVPQIERNLTKWNTDLHLRKVNAGRISEYKKSIENDKVALKDLTQKLTDGNGSLEKRVR